MTKNEAYDAMQQGLLVTHTSFLPGQYIYMDESFIMRDETNHEFEESWDALTNDMFKTGWCISKGHIEENKKLLGFIPKKQAQLPQLVSHVRGLPCCGKNRCLQYCNGGESACLFCDVNQDKLNVDNTLQIELKDDNNNDVVIETTLIEPSVQQQVQAADPENIPSKRLLILCITSGLVMGIIVVIIILILKTILF